MNIYTVLRLKANMWVITKIYLLLLLFVTVHAFGQDALYIKGKQWEGYAFPKEIQLQGFPPEPNRYTLNRSEIFLVEDILKSNRIDLYNDKNKRKEVRLKKYYRQYIGFLNAGGHIIVKIHFIRKEDISINELSTGLISVFDGGGTYFEVTIDITDKKVLNIEQNGYS